MSFFALGVNPHLITKSTSRTGLEPATHESAHRRFSLGAIPLDREGNLKTMVLMFKFLQYPSFVKCLAPMKIVGKLMHCVQVQVLI
jgi:hypothetical protein